MPESAATPTTTRRSRLGLLIGLLAGLALLAAAYAMWRHDDLYPSTQDAYLEAHFTWVAPQVTGQIIEKFVQPNEFVRIGQPLFKIDPRPFQDRLQQALANQVLVGQQILADQQRISSLADLVQKQQALIALSQQEDTRLQPLLAQGYAAEIKGITVQDTLLSQQAQLASIQAQLAETITSLGAVNVQQARRQQAAADVALAQLNLDWTTVSAPTDGWVTQFNLRVGDVVQPGQPLFPFIEAHHWWIMANFKETHIHRVKPGQPVTFTVDMYPGHTFNGTVHSLSTGVAASFSLLPPQNTTGNWVKVTQRVPVRILVDDPPAFPFRLGASVEATVDTTAPAVGPVRNDIFPEDESPPAASSNTTVSSTPATPPTASSTP
jgi:membrane fusion protein (multidrug efflux system)